MAHGIMANDRGFVGFSEIYGGTWHGLPQYKVIEGEVSEDQLRSIVAYEIQKMPLCLPNGTIVQGANALVRADTNDIVMPSVGDDYTVLQNTEFVEWCLTRVINPNKGLVKLESAGTLFNGKVFFLNLAFPKIVIPGDVSETANKLFYSNHHGNKACTAGLHSTRIVCNNTLTLAEGQAAANKTLCKFSHTQSIKYRVENFTISLGETAKAIEDHTEKLAWLATKPMNQDEVNRFLDDFMPIPKKDAAERQTAVTRSTNSRSQLVDIYENCDNLQGTIARTRYAMLQSVTDYLDHFSTFKETSDVATKWYDGLWGSKGEKKQKALQLLTTMV